MNTTQLTASLNLSSQSAISQGISNSSHFSPNSVRNNSDGRVNFFRPRGRRNFSKSNATPANARGNYIEDHFDNRIIIKQMVGFAIRSTPTTQVRAATAFIRDRVTFAVFIDVQASRLPMRRPNL